MHAPAYDLRTEARTSGNPDRLPRRWRLPMMAITVVLAGSLGVFTAARVGGIILERKKTALVAEQEAIAARVAILDGYLAVPRWRNATLATQPVIVRLLAAAPQDVTLSELSFQTDTATKRYRFRAGINSDRNTAARRFREMLGHLQLQEGLQVVSIQQVNASGAVVFEATLAPSAPSVAPAPAESEVIASRP